MTIFGHGATRVNPTRACQGVNYCIHMSNAAEALADLLESWRVQGNHQNFLGRFPEGQAVFTDTWRRQAQAVELLVEVDRSLDRLEELGKPKRNVDAFRKHLITLYQAVFGYTPAWRGQAASTGPYVDPQATGALRQLGMLLNMTDLVPVAETEQIEQIRDLLSDAYDEVRKATSLPREARYFLFHLLSEARRYVDEVSTFGSSKAHAAILALCVEMENQGVQLEAHEREEQVGGMRKVARALVSVARATFRAGAKSAGEIAASEATPRAIEMGTQALDIARDSLS